MNTNEKNNIAQIYAQLAMAFGRTLERETLSFMVTALDDLNFESVKKVMLEWNRTETIFPQPAHIRNKIIPSITDKDESIDAVNLALMCVSKFGYTNQNEAKLKMGSLAWEAVQRFGGWKHLCEILDQQNEGMIRAQLRELCLVVSKKSQRGELDQKPELKNNVNLGIDFSKVFKSIE